MITINYEHLALRVGLTAVALMLAGLGLTAARLAESYAVMRRWDRETQR